MNTSSKRSDIESVRTTVSFMFMKAIENKLDKGQKDGDATKVVTSNGIEVVDEFTPRIEANVEKYEVVLDGDTCKRIEKGKATVIKADKKRREMQKASIKENSEDISLENNDIDK